jgi:hypothetical protein
MEEASKAKRGVKLKEHKLKGDDDSQTSVEDVDLRKIADPQEKYGTAFRDKGISFPKLRQIQYWYKTTFGKSAMLKLFEENNRIGALSAVRNVIVHKAGVVDQKYVHAVKDFPELASGVQEHKPINLNGEIVRELRNAAINLGNELLLFVDAGITPQKKNT